MQKKFRNILFSFLILAFVLAFGGFIAAVAFVSDDGGFDIRNILQRDKQNQGQLEEKIEEQVTKRVVVLEENAVIDVIENSSPAVVSIIAEGVSLDPFQGFVQEDQGIGTGFLVEGGYVFTNKHVVSQDLNYRVLLNDGETSLQVLSIETDPLSDFAILIIDDEGEDLPYLELGDSDNIKVGQTVIAIGNALGEFSGTASKGIISGIGRSIVAGGPAGAELLDNVIQTDAALNPGNSGGPLLDLDGNVIGINVARAGAENIGFALPINSLKPVVESFQNFGEIRRPFLGIEYSINTAEASKLNRVPVGAVVRSVLPDTPASKAGLERFDVITSIDGEQVNSDNTLAKIISEKQVGDTITMEVDRGGDELTLETVLETAE